MVLINFCVEAKQAPSLLQVVISGGSNGKHRKKTTKFPGLRRLGKTEV